MQNQKEYWNSVAEEKTFTVPLQFDLFKQYVAKEASILDMGCGYGRTLYQLKQAGYHNLTGVDFSSKMIARGKKLYPDINFKAVDEELSFAKKSFNAVILFAVLTCIEQNQKQQALIDKIRYILKPGGIIYINDFLLNDDERNKERYLKYQNQFENYGIFQLPEGAIVRHHDKDWINELLKDFTQLKLEETEYITMNGHKSRGFYFFGEKTT